MRNPERGKRRAVSGRRTSEHGRYRRKIVAPEKLKLKFRVKYAVGESFRYAAHLDIVRAVYRALRRSEVPIAYSQGFAPRPSVAFGPPLPVGLTSIEEYLDLQMAGTIQGTGARPGAGDAA